MAPAFAVWWKSARKRVGACHGHSVGTKEELCVIGGLSLKATVTLLIYFFSEENNTRRNFAEKHWLESSSQRSDVALKPKISAAGATYRIFTAQNNSLCCYSGP